MPGRWRVGLKLKLFKCMATEDREIESGLNLLAHYSCAEHSSGCLGVEAKVHYRRAKSEDREGPIKGNMFSCLHCGCL